MVSPLTSVCCPVLAGGDWGGGQNSEEDNRNRGQQEEKPSTVTARMAGSERLHQEFNHEQN